MANKYLHASAGTGNWSDATGTWRTTDQGATVAAAPTSADVAFCTVNAGARTLTIDATTNVAQQLNCTGFTGTLESSNAANILTITTNITIPATTSFGATAFLLKAGTGTATINMPTTFPWNFQWGGTGTKTLSANTVISGVTYMSASITLNGNKWTTNGIEALSVSSATMQGTVELEVTGGNYNSIVKRTALGKLTFNGDITIKGDKISSQKTGIYDCIFTYVSGTITVDPDVTFSMTGTNTVNVGSNIIFQNIDCYGKTTLLSDLYIAKSLQCAGTLTMTFVGAYTIHVGYGGGSDANINMYNAGTFISTTTKISYEGTGTIFRPTSYNGMIFEAVSALQIDLEINTPGTVTFQPIGTKNQWGNGRKLTYIAGTVVATGCTFQVVSAGGYTFDVNNAFTVPTFINTTATTFLTAFSASAMTLNTASSTNAIGNLTVDTLRMDGSAILYKPNDATIVNVTTNFYQNGTDSLTPCIVASPITVTDFATGMATSMTNTGGSGSTNKRLSFPDSGNMTDFTIAFDMVYKGDTAYTTFQGVSGYVWLPTSFTRFYYYMKPVSVSDAYYFTHGMTIGQKYRVVMRKASGSAMKANVNGVVKSVGTIGSAANLLTGYTSFYTVSNEPIGDVLIFNTSKDDAWVAADYAKFQAGGSSTNGAYDNTEANLVYGWHVDQFTPDVTGMNFKYDGTLLNERSSYGEFRYVDASTSAVPIRTMFGLQNDSLNVFPNTLQDIGGGGVSVTHY